MKKVIGLIISLILLIGCTDKNDITQLNWPQNETSIFISTDLHWQTDKSQNRTEYLDEIISTLFYEVTKEGSEILILGGDIANSGRLDEHLEVVKMLEELEKQGTEVFVTMGNHDVDGNVAVDDLKEIYNEFGFKDAISYDKDSMSYLAELNEEMWLMSLDFNLYEERDSTMAAMYTDDTFEWIEKSLKKASEEGVMLIPFGHHNLIENSMEGFNHHYNIENGDKIAELFLRYGVPIYLSGHKHSSIIDVVENNENKLYEIVSDAPMNYPYRYTKLTFNDNKTIDYKIKNLDVENWAKSVGIKDNNILNFNEYSRELYEIKTRENAESATKDLTDNEEEREEMISYYIDIFNSSINRTLWRDRESLKKSSALPLWEKYENENIFGKWIPWMINSNINDKAEQTLYFE